MLRGHVGSRFGRGSLKSGGVMLWPALWDVRWRAGLPMPSRGSRSIGPRDIICSRAALFLFCVRGRCVGEGKFRVGCAECAMADDDLGLFGRAVRQEADDAALFRPALAKVWGGGRSGCVGRGWRGRRCGGRRGRRWWRTGSGTGSAMGVAASIPSRGRG